MAQLPPDLPTFVGREAELTKLPELLDDRSVDRTCRSQPAPALLAVLSRTGLAPSDLALEITESAVVDPKIGIPALRAPHPLLASDERRRTHRVGE